MVVHWPFCDHVYVDHGVYQVNKKIASFRAPHYGRNCQKRQHTEVEFSDFDWSVRNSFIADNSSQQLNFSL